MSTKIAIFIGIGKHNKGDITAFGYEHSIKQKIGDISGDEGFEKVKLSNSIVELGELPDISALIKQRHDEMIEAEKLRHEMRMKELNEIQAA